MTDADVRQGHRRYPSVIPDDPMCILVSQVARTSLATEPSRDGRVAIGRSAPHATKIALALGGLGARQKDFIAFAPPSFAEIHQVRNGWDARETLNLCPDSLNKAMQMGRRGLGSGRCEGSYGGCMGT